MGSDSDMRIQLPNSSVALLGPDAAEKDDNLRSYFLRTGTWRRVISGNAFIVLGRKGAGKSAIFRMITEDCPSGSIVASASPRIFALDIFNDYITRYPDSPFNREIAYANAWRYSLMLEVLLAIEKTGSMIKVGAAAGVHDWLRKHEQFNTDIIARAVAFLESWTVSGAKIGELILDRNASRREAPVGSEIGATLEVLQNFLEKTKVFLVIDDLDQGWRDTEEARAYLMGLIMAAHQLHCIKNLHVTLFLRTDAFRTIASSQTHIDKLRDSIEQITWTAQSLRSLVCERIRNYYDIPPESNIATWQRVFPDRMDNDFYVYKHIVERTLLRPRDILQFCRHCVDTAIRYKKHSVEVRDIYDAESAYSSWKIDDLSGEYSAYYDNLKSLLLAFRGDKVMYSRDELREQTGIALGLSSVKVHGTDIKPSVDAAIDILYSIGFMRARQRGGDGKWRYITSQMNPDILSPMIEYWDIHPAFRANLSVGPAQVDKRRSRTMRRQRF